MVIEFSLNILPDFAVYYVAYSNLADAICFADIGLSDFSFRINRANFTGVFGGNFGEATAFLIHVDQILFLISKKKMLRLHARPVVALMQNADVFWQMAVVQFETGSMRENHSAIQSKATIACLILSTLPHKAIAFCCSLGKKMLKNLHNSIDL